jgi:4-amino-4-deoxy-L-arabinose transferase-like glycosyltransferase
MNIPSPALVTQSAVRRLPRWALVLFSVLYVLPGFIGRESWKVQDGASFGVMLSLAKGDSDWWAPTIFDQLPDTLALLPYWLGALSIQFFGVFDAEFAARIPFAMLLGLTMASVWYSVYQLAHLPMAQPVVFAFGGQAKRSDYARAMADAGLLMLLACLGLARMGHETTADLASLGFLALMLWSASAWIAPQHPKRWRAIVAWPIAVMGLGLSGQSLLAGVMATSVGLCLLYKNRSKKPQAAEPDFGAYTSVATIPTSSLWLTAAPSVVAMATAAAAIGLHLQLPIYGSAYQYVWLDEPSLGWFRWLKLLSWFVWPAGPLALWALWRWRAHWRSAHVWLPLWFSIATVIVAMSSSSPERTILLALPGLAVLASFALPTLKRRANALIDWFALLFFTGAAIIVWVVWLAMHTGFPAQPAANVVRLAPGFEPQFSAIPTLIALLATGIWFQLIRWRTRSVVPALWKSLVLSAGGTTMCWLLLMTLWMPLLDHGLSYGNVSRAVASVLDSKSCVRTIGLSQDQLSSLRYHGRLQVKPDETGENCSVLLVSSDAASRIGAVIDLPQWALRQQVWQLNKRSEIIYIYQRIGN